MNLGDYLLIHQDMGFESMFKIAPMLAIASFSADMSGRLDLLALIEFGILLTLHFFDKIRVDGNDFGNWVRLGLLAGGAVLVVGAFHLCMPFENVFRQYLAWSAIVCPIITMTWLTYDNMDRSWPVLIVGFLILTAVILVVRSYWTVPRLPVVVTTYRSPRVFMKRAGVAVFSEVPKTGGG